MERVLGVDSGGTKTIAVVADRSGQIVAAASGEGLDPTAGDQWQARLAALIGPFGPIVSATLGLPFHGEVAEITAQQQVVAKELIGDHAQVVNDVAVAFEGALAGQDGVLILAGTGSMAWARGSRGTVRIGGWGDAFGDEGSAYWIGREALGLVSKHLDGRMACPAFARGILTGLGINGDGLIGWAYRQADRRVSFAAVARHVSALAADGDADARQLLDRAAACLSVLCQTAVAASGAQKPLHWSYAGGVFADAGLRAAVVRQMQSDPVPPHLPPVGGAILLAAKAAGWAVDATFINALQAALTAHPEVTSYQSPPISKPQAGQSPVRPLSASS
jgi:glucosamine kinase